MRACESISAILTAHGNAAPTRTPTDCCASTSPKGPISACTAPTRLQPWPPPSTRGPERRLIGRHPQRRLTGFSYQPTKIVLRRPFESALQALLQPRLHSPGLSAADPRDAVRRPQPRLPRLGGRAAAGHLRQSMDVSRARRSVWVGGWDARIYPACCGTICAP